MYPSQGDHDHGYGWGVLRELVPRLVGALTVKLAIDRPLTFEPTNYLLIKNIYCFHLVSYLLGNWTPFSVFVSCQYLFHVPRHNMAALVISLDTISSKEIIYNVKKKSQTVVNWRSLCVLVPCCSRFTYLHSPSLKFITLLYILFLKRSKKDYFIPETTKVCTQVTCR